MSQMTIQELKDALHVFLETGECEPDDKVFIRYDGGYSDAVNTIGFYVAPTKGIWLGHDVAVITRREYALGEEKTNAPDKS